MAFLPFSNLVFVIFSSNTSQCSEFAPEPSLLQTYPNQRPDSQTRPNDAHNSLRKMRTSVAPLQWPPAAVPLAKANDHDSGNGGVAADTVEAAVRVLLRAGSGDASADDGTTDMLRQWLRKYAEAVWATAAASDGTAQLEVRATQADSAFHSKRRAALPDLNHL